MAQVKTGLPPDSRLFQSTVSVANSVYRKDDKEESKLLYTKEVPPDSRLLIPTAAVLNGTYRRDDDESVIDKLVALNSKPVAVSPHLLYPTASNLNSIQQIHEQAKVNDEMDDIWWDKRSPRNDMLNKLPNKYENVESRLFEETTAYAAMKMSKSEKSDAFDITNFSKSFIDPGSHVLQPTFAALQAAWNIFVPTEQESSELRLHTSKLAPKDVESRLYETTKAAEAARWKPKAEEPEEDAYMKPTMKVAKVSERLVQPTAANVHGKYDRASRPMSVDRTVASRSSSRLRTRRTSPSSSEVSTESRSTSTSRKVKETSIHLLIPTASVLHGQYRSPSPQPTFRRDIEVKVSDHLLEPTAAVDHGKYRKQEIDVDPRELGWKPPSPKANIPLYEEVIYEADSNLKVAAPSERLLTPTIATVYQKWSGSTESPHLRTLSSQSSEESSRKLLNIAPVSPAEHFLSPTAASVNSTYKNAKLAEKPEVKTGIKVIEPSSRLLEPTLNNQIDHWSKLHPKTADPKPIECVNESIYVEKPAYYCKCYACEKMQAYNWRTPAFTERHKSPRRNISEMVLHSDSKLRSSDNIEQPLGASTTPALRKSFYNTAPDGIYFLGNNEDDDEQVSTKSYPVERLAFMQSYSNGDVKTHAISNIDPNENVEDDSPMNSDAEQELDLENGDHSNQSSEMDIEASPDTEETPEVVDDSIPPAMEEIEPQLDEETEDTMESEEIVIEETVIEETIVESITPAYEISADRNDQPEEQIVAVTASDDGEADMSNQAEDVAPEIIPVDENLDNHQEEILPEVANEPEEQQIVDSLDDIEDPAEENVDILPQEILNEESDITNIDESDQTQYIIDESQNNDSINIIGDEHDDSVAEVSNDLSQPENEENDAVVETSGFDEAEEVDNPVDKVTDVEVPVLEMSPTDVNEFEGNELEATESALFDENTGINDNAFPATADYLVVNDAESVAPIESSSIEVEESNDVNENPLGTGQVITQETESDDLETSQNEEISEIPTDELLNDSDGDAITIKDGVSSSEISPNDNEYSMIESDHLFENTGDGRTFFDDNNVATEATNHTESVETVYYIAESSTIVTTDDSSELLSKQTEEFQTSESMTAVEGSSITLSAAVCDDTEDVDSMDDSSLTTIGTDKKSPRTVKFVIPSEENNESVELNHVKLNDGHSSSDVLFESNRKPMVSWDSDGLPSRSREFEDIDHGGAISRRNRHFFPDDDNLPTNRRPLRHVSNLSGTSGSTDNDDYMSEGDGYIDPDGHRRFPSGASTTGDGGRFERLNKSAKFSEPSYMSWTKRGSPYSNANTPENVGSSWKRGLKLSMEAEDIETRSFKIGGSRPFSNYDSSAKSPRWAGKHLRRVNSGEDSLDTDEYYSDEYDDDSDSQDRHIEIDGSEGQDKSKSSKYNAPSYMSWTKLGSSSKYVPTNKVDDRDYSWKVSSSRKYNPADLDENRGKSPEWMSKALRHVERGRDSTGPTWTNSDLRHVDMESEDNSQRTNIRNANSKYLPWKAALKRTGSPLKPAVDGIRPSTVHVESYLSRGSSSPRATIPSVNYSRPTSYIPTNRSGVESSRDEMVAGDGSVPWKVALKRVPSKRGSAYAFKAAKADQRQLQTPVLSENRVSQNSTIIIPETKSVRDLVRRFQKD